MSNRELDYEEAVRQEAEMYRIQQEFLAELARRKKEAGDGR